MSVVTCFVGIGSNLNQPTRRIAESITALNNISAVTLERVSSVYQTDPMGPADQPVYLNAVAQLSTSLAPLALLDTLQGVENEQGRVRTNERWTARTLDLDLLLYGDQQIDHERLTVPHPGMTVRSFVLVPLLEIAPDVEIPGKGPAADYRANCEDFGIQCVEKRHD